MTAGERVFIDLLPEKWIGLPPALPAEVVKELSERALAAERALRLQKMADEAKKRPPVRVRASVQPTFVRFVFEMPDGVDVSSSLNADKFSLSFTSALTFDLADAKIAMPANIQSINQKAEGDTSRVDVASIGEVDVRSHSARTRPTSSTSAFDQAQKPPQTANSPETKTSPAAAPPGDKASDVVPPIAEQIAREAALDVKPEVKLPAVVTDEKPAAVPAKPEATIEAAPAPKPVAAVEVPVNVAPVPSPPKPKNAPPPDALAVSPAPGVVVDARLSSDDFRLTFPFKSPTAAAVFRRSDSIWMVFDTDQAIDASAIRREGASIVADATTVDLPKGRAIRIRLNRPQLAALIGDELWIDSCSCRQGAVDRRSRWPPRATSPIRSAPVSASVWRSPDKLHRFDDPDAGDALLVDDRQPAGARLCQASGFRGILAAGSRSTASLFSRNPMT